MKYETYVPFQKMFIFTVCVLLWLKLVFPAILVHSLWLFIIILNNITRNIFFSFLLMS